MVDGRCVLAYDIELAPTINGGNEGNGCITDTFTEKLWQESAKKFVTQRRSTLCPQISGRNAQRSFVHSVDRKASDDFLESCKEVRSNDGFCIIGKIMARQRRLSQLSLSPHQPS